ncbi:MAG: hypothetical protein ABIH27_00540 [Candidatus Omnitrophota bacterium]
MIRLFFIIFFMSIYLTLAAPPNAVEAVNDDQPEFVGLRKVEYSAEGLKDPFRSPPSLDPQEIIDNSAIAAAAAEKTLPVFTIQGVIWGGNNPLVIINDKILKIGDSIEDCRILEIDKEGVTVFYINKRHTLPLPGGLKGGTDEKGN